MVKVKYRENPARKMYARAVRDSYNNKKPSKPVQKTGGLLRRDVSMQKEETNKKMQPFDEVLDAFKQVQEARRNLM
tara:strand:+ start:776 stop:1003 length:228 start_codon:yes stop_codon:yes gene_type:complete